MSYEIVQQHEFQDIYRLDYGVLLIVNKFERGNYDTFSNIDKKKLKKIKGMKNCYQFKEDVTKYDRTYKAGEIFYENVIIKPTDDYIKYKVELKLSGGIYSGDVNSHLKLYEQIKEILSAYIK